MLLSTLLSFLQPAEACVAPLSVESTFPASGSMNLAMDTQFQLRFSCAEMLEEPKIILEQDGEIIEADVAFHRRTIAEGVESVVAEVQPLEALTTGSSVLLSVEYFGMQTPAATFVVGDSYAESEIAEVPTIYWMSRYDVSYEAPEGECAFQKEGEIYFDVELPQSDDLAIRIYEINPELRGQEIFTEMLQTPFHTITNAKSWDEMSVLVPQEMIEATELCFTATYMNEAGVESAPSPVQCMSDMYFEDFVCGTGMMFGCSTMAPIELGWFAIMMGAMGLFRRRWE